MPQKISKLPITNDYVFKRVFSYEGNEAILKDFLEAILNIKINKIQIKNPDMKAKINQWLWLLAGKEDKIKMAKKENEQIKKAVETLDRISLDPAEREWYESVKMREFLQRISNQKFKEEGEKQGIRQEKIEIAKKLLLENMSVKRISLIT